MSSHSSEPVRREAKAQSRETDIKLRDIVVDNDASTSLIIRQEDAYKAEAVESLAESYVREGQLAPLIVTPYGDKGQYKLVSGHRRFHAMKKNVEGKAPEHSEDMFIKAIIKERGADQTQEEFERELIVTAVSENNQREAMNDFERLIAIEKMHKRGVSAKRGACSLSISDEHYRRLLKIVTTSWMHKHVRDGVLGTSFAAKILSACSKGVNEAVATERLASLERDLSDWCKRCWDRLRQEEDDARKLNKKLGDTQKKLKKYLTADIQRDWESAIKENRRPKWTLKVVDKDNFAFGVVVRDETISIPRVEIKIAKATSLTIHKIMLGLTKGIRDLGPLYKKLKQSEIHELTREEQEEIERELKESLDQEEEAQAGRDPSDDDEPESSFTNEIENEIGGREEDEE